MVSSNSAGGLGRIELLVLGPTDQHKFPACLIPLINFASITGLNSVACDTQAVTLDCHYGLSRP